ncbi:beta-lactamase superfamily domain-containing protein [Thermoascus aurantiacus ATCC 26904]
MGSSTTAVLYAATISASPVSPTPDDAAQKSHHLKVGFRNPWDSWRDLQVFRILRSMIYRRLTGQANVPDTTPPTVPVQTPEFLPSRETPRLRATWLGHACYYVEFPSGLRVLFDPVFEDRCSPLSWLGPKRYTEMPCKISDIPIIDAVVISHNHYDHLSYPTVREIAKRHPNCQFFAPLGNKQWFVDSGIHNVTELDWWEERDLTLSPPKSASDVAPTGESQSKNADIVARISCLPCQHTSNRGLFDRSKTLWSSWCVESGGKKVYFAGDTGYRAVPELPKGTDDHGPEHKYPVCPAFAQIGQFRGPFDLGLIPIGAYEPRWIMSPMHADPHDAVNIFQDTKCKKALGMHWGTWVLTEEDVLEPPKKLKEALKRNNIPETGVFDVCNIGESREF